MCRRCVVDHVFTSSRRQCATLERGVSGLSARERLKKMLLRSGATSGETVRASEATEVMTRAWFGGGGGERGRA